ncbi:SDR family NAD(P)-dependent oxidoreductase [Asticcacaulis sp. BYS171W]|uniref:SDR family NAD(P)-dependent oxidoreductase n=1 Tax=Asticcacaulis aquaticus TaxID=2984212 RepID=A0ABT5HPU9_9CAUL|nr:SDR family NAD(P)-dependent oxidoreductase [Asticcacaulis aquaticus]MDC7682014.1 SDR family NAD(P)-dependent oxidoreductase [Asticcacaulis aquaticus]
MSEPLLTGRIALVTGASRGIGRASALGLARAGAHVIACARTQGALEELDDQIFAETGRHATLMPFDLADGAALERIGQAVFDRFQKLDIFVHAAATLGSLTPVSHYEPKDFNRVITLNLNATYRLIRQLEPLLKFSDAARAIFISSGVANHPRAFWGAYAASKAGMEALVKTWADEMEVTPIRTALVNPGAMRTRMRYEAFPGEDPETLPLPEEIIPLIVDLARADKVPPLDVIDRRAWSAAQNA